MFHNTSTVYLNRYFILYMLVPDPTWLSTEHEAEPEAALLKPVFYICTTDRCWVCWASSSCRWASEAWTSARLHTKGADGIRLTAGLSAALQTNDWFLCDKSVSALWLDGVAGRGVSSGTEGWMRMLPIGYHHKKKVKKIIKQCAIISVKSHL